MAQGYWLTIFGGYQRWAATPRDRLIGFDGYRRRAATWWLHLAIVWQWREEEEVPIVVCVVSTPWWDYKWVCSHPNNWTKVALEIQLNSLWATKRNAQVSFCIARCDTGPPAPTPREPKKLQDTNRALNVSVDMFAIFLPILIHKKNKHKWEQNRKR
jgi:hypothetical protein